MYRAALNIEPRPSRILRVSSGILHAAAGIAVVMASIPLWIKAGLLVGIGWSLIRTDYRYGWRHSGGFIARIEWLDDRWYLETGNGVRYPARLVGGYAHPKIVVLNFCLESGRRWPLVLLPDAVDVESLRRLRVWLRIRPVNDASDHP